MSIVGRAYVTVRAVTRQLPKDIDDAVNKSLKDVDSKIGSKVGDKVGDSVSKGVNKGVEDGIRDGIGNSNVDRDAGGLGEKVGSALGDGIGKGVKDSDVDKSIHESVRKYKTGSDEDRAGALIGEAISNSLFNFSRTKGVGRKLGSLLIPDANKDGDTKRRAQTFGDRVMTMVAASMVTAAPKVMFSSLILPAVSEGLPLVSGLSAATVALAQTLGPTLAAGAGVGANALAGLLTTVGTLTLAFKVQTSELDRFKGSLGPVRDQWKGYASDVQRVVLPAVTDAATRITAALGPTLRLGMVSTGREIAGVTRQLTRLAETASFQDRLGRVMQSNAISVGNFGSAAVHAVSSAVSLAAAAGPLTQRFSGWLATVSASIDRQLQAADASGKLTAWFNRAGDTAAKWGDILGSTGSALFRVFSLGREQGALFLDGLDKITTRFEAWTKSAEGTQKITAWFQSSVPVMDSLGKVVEGATKGFMNWADTTDNAVHILNGLAGVLPPLGTILGAMSISLSGLLGVLGPVLTETAKLAPTWQKTGAALWSNLGPALKDVMPPLVSIADSALRIVGGFTPAIRVVGALAAGLANGLAPAAHIIANVFESLPSPIRATVGALILLRITAGKVLATNLGAGLAQWVVGLSKASTASELAARRMVMLRGGAAIAGIALLSISGKADEASSKLGDLTTVSGGAAMGFAAGGPWGAVAGGILASLSRIQDGVKATMSALDQADSALDTGNIDDMSKALDRLKKSYTDASNNMNSIPMGLGLVGLIPNITGGIQALMLHFQGAGDKMDSLKTGINAYKSAGESAGVMQKAWAGALGVTTDELNGQVDATKRAQAAAQSYRSTIAANMISTLDFKDAIAAAREAIAGNSKTMNINTQAGRDNRRTLIGIAESASKVKGSTEKQAAAMARARKVIIDMATDLFHSRKEAVQFADRLIDVTNASKGIPKRVMTKLEQTGYKPSVGQLKDLIKKYQLTPDKVKTIVSLIGTDLSKKQLAGLIRQAKEFDRSDPKPKTSVQNVPKSLAGLMGVTRAAQKLDAQRPTPKVNVDLGDAIRRMTGFRSDASKPIHTDWNIVRHVMGAVGQGPRGADGGTVTGAPRYPYGDKVLYALAPGEEIISNRYGQADANRALLKAINRGENVAGRSASTGGTATAAPAGPGIVYNITVNNPRTERTSDSIPRALRRARDLGPTAGGLN